MLDAWCPMTHRDRLLTALDHREPDRVPLSPVHNIQADVPPENIVAMLEALQEFGVY